MDSRSLLRWSAATLVAAALAGCGHTARVGSSGTLRVGLREFRVTPQKVHAATGSLTIYIHNYGRLTHNLVITTTSGKRDAVSDPIAPGQSGTLTTSLPPGTYTIESAVLSDKQLGAYGTLQVG